MTMFAIAGLLPESSLLTANTASVYLTVEATKNIAIGIE